MASTRQVGTSLFAQAAIAGKVAGWALGPILVGGLGAAAALLGVVLAFDLAFEPPTDPESVRLGDRRLLGLLGTAIGVGMGVALATSRAWWWSASTTTSLWLVVGFLQIWVFLLLGVDFDRPRRRRWLVTGIAAPAPFVVTLLVLEKGPGVTVFVWMSTAVIALVGVILFSVGRSLSGAARGNGGDPSGEPPE